MCNLKEFYNKRIRVFTESEIKLRKRRNIITLCKVICFCAIIYTGYGFAVSYKGFSAGGFKPGFLYVLIFLLPGYILLSIYDSKILSGLTRYKALIKCNKTEADYLAGDYTHLKNGQEFSDPSHIYTNDLDIFGDNSLYQEINRTVTRNGAIKLAGMLQTNCKDAEQIKLRQECAGELKDDIDFCHNFRAAGINNPVDELSGEVISQWINKKPLFGGRFMVTFVYLLNMIMLAVSVSAVAAGLEIGYICIIFLIQLSITMYRAAGINKLSEELGIFIKALSKYIYLIEVMKNKSFRTKGMIKIQEGIFGEKDAIKAFKNLKRIQDTLDSRINVVLMFILNGLYMRDLHTVFRMEKWKREYLSNVPEWIECISSIDAYISMANYRFNHPGFTIPHIDTSLSPDLKESGVFSAKNMGHPLLHCPDVVTNDFGISSLHEFYIITGANMAGKSTFLRAAGINMVLALSGNPVFAEEFSCIPITLFTSMRTTDNLAEGKSYFHAELLRLKELINIAGKEPLLIILDEMLKGTNSADKLNGSVKFLKKLLTLPVCGLVATHDLALGNLKNEYSDNFRNLCFEIEHTGDNIIYDYKLRDGISKNMNASILLEKMGLL